MNKKAIIQTQVVSQLKGLALFLIGYFVFFTGSVSIKRINDMNFDFDGITYIFVIYLALLSWILTSGSIKLYSYHSYSRQSVISRTAISQLIISCIASLLIEGHTWLMKLFPVLSENPSANNVKNVYINQLTSNLVLKSVLTYLFVTLAIFTLLQFTNLILIGTYGMRLRTQIISLFILAVIVLSVLFSFPYWSKPMIGFSIMIFGFIFGTGQSFVPSVVIPLILLILISIVSYLLSHRWIKRLEIYKNSKF